MSQPPPLPPPPPPPPAGAARRVIPSDLEGTLRKPPRRGLYLLIGGVLSVVVVGVGLLVFAVVMIVRSLAWPTPDQPGFAESDAAVKQSSTAINSAGTQVALDIFEPAQAGKYPVVLVVHGWEGLSQKEWQRYYAGQCQELARNGHIAVLVHYFDRTGGQTSSPGAAKQNLEPWSLTLLDALSYATALPGGDGKKVGVVGTNLGGALATALSAFDQRIGAVVQCSGMVPKELKGKGAKMPPVLLLHGANNRYVPLDELRKGEKLLADEKVTHEVHVYQNQGYTFRGDDAQDALSRTVAFLKKHLK